MNCTIENKSNSLAILKLQDRVTVYQLQEFKELFRGVGQKIGERKRLLLDFGSLHYMDPLALGVIVAFSKEFRESGGDIKIVSMKGDLKLIFDLSRLSKVYETYGTVEEAERSFI